ncbi:ABC transporter permease [Mycoplasma sp. U97]|uniref:ABC transporter permease n=1 Tax=Mycoplasma tauri TaxID=547987 RepID=UPI001CBE70C9|nr:ABC transporter permease [Mycoplasma tauri]MBZ4212932.1 ABC transporter permease [Mycoplasma tauri]
MKTTAFKYSSFAFNTVLKKKSSILMPMIVLFISILFKLITIFFIQNKYVDLAVYLYTFTIIVVTVLYASIKSLNIFRDFEHEGMELISIAKPITRNKLVFGKLLTLTYFGIIWALVLFISSLIAIPSNYGISYMFVYSLLFFVSGFATYLLISLFTALIGYKLNQKIAMTLPLVLFIPFALGGSLLSANATSNVNNAAYFINQKYPYHLSGNEANVEPYFINNNKDELLIIPNGANNKTFSDEQKSYLENVMNVANKSSSEWQIYSWFSLPYQLLDIFNRDNKNVFKSISKNDFSNLDNYVYYNNLDDITYKYKLDKNTEHKKYNVSPIPELTENKYIVPGMLKSHSIMDNLIDTDIIYARENAENRDISFPEDDASFAAQNNLVGKLKWSYVYEVLKDENFNNIAAKFVDDFNKKITSEQDLTKINTKLFEEISLFANNPESLINTYVNNNLTIFDENAIKHKKLQSEFERKIYFSVAILNYIYFNNNGSKLYEAMIKNPTNENQYGDYQININISGFNYRIGGFKKYDPEVITREENKKTKILTRYNLMPSDSNYLFQSTDELFVIRRDKQIVNKNAYFVIWTTVILILFVSVFALYRKKDYK